VLLLLAILHLVSGLMLAAMLPDLFSKLAEFSSLDGFGLSPFAIVGGSVLLTLLFLASAIGIISGGRWGWWVIKFNAAYGVMRNASACVVAFDYAEADDATRSLEEMLLKHGIRGALYGLMLAYFYSTQVRRYFRTESVATGRSLGILFGIYCAIAVVSSIALSL
jgi:hypothetical protein